MSNKKILIIIPAYNESGNIQKIVEEVSQSSVAPDVLVVNDGSTDDTDAQARKTSAHVITLPFNLGIGGAVQTGFRFAKRHNYDIAAQIDGDGQHDPAYLDKLLGPVLAGQVDIAIGSRFIPPFLGYQSSFLRRIGINFFAYLISFLTRCKITDPTSGFRAFNRKAIDIFAKDYPPDFPEPESIVMAKQLGLNLVEVPVEMRKRARGSSSIRYLKTLYYMIKVTFAILLDMIKYRR